MTQIFNSEYRITFMFNMWYVKWLSISYHYSLFTILFKWFIFLIVYLFIIYLTYWKSITYLETSLGFQMFILFIWKLFLSTHSLLRECHFANSPIKSKGLNWYLRECMREQKFMSLWALLILILWFVSQFARMIWSQKIFLPMDMALYTIYRGHPGTAPGA